MIPVLPTAYFGSIAYFKKIAEYSDVLIEAYEHFPKQTYRNRCDILASEGFISLSIPTTKPNGTKTLTKDIQLSDYENWRARHWRSITSAYQSAAFFDYYGMEVKDLLFNDTNSLLELNTAITRRVVEWLELDVNIAFTDEFAPVQENDFRDVLVKKNAFHSVHKSPYIQVFPSDTSFRESLTILDAIFCEGPMARNLLIAPH